MRKILYIKLLISFSLFAQDGIPKINDLVKIPNSPEAEAFIKYGEIPIYLSTREHQMFLFLSIQ